jgi:hypothetical protein
MAKAPSKGKRTVAKSGNTDRTKRYTRVYLELWSLAVRLASESGKLSFTYDPHNPKVGMSKIKRLNSNGTGATKDYRVVRDLYDRLVALNNEKIQELKQKGTFTRFKYVLP